MPHGVFARMMEGLAFEATEQKTVMIATTYLKARRTASDRKKHGGTSTSRLCHEPAGEDGLSERNSSDYSLCSRI